ncbi:MAG: hypothetical protein ABIG93_03455 [archaeon]|nr:hypothetical protein [Nanoarchaeota archaeon]
MTKIIDDVIGKILTDSKIDLMLLRDINSRGRQTYCTAEGLREANLTTDYLLHDFRNNLEKKGAVALAVLGGIACTVGAVVMYSNSSKGDTSVSNGLLPLAGAVATTGLVFGAAKLLDDYVTKNVDQRYNARYMVR